MKRYTLLFLTALFVQCLIAQQNPLAQQFAFTQANRYQALGHIDNTIVLSNRDSYGSGGMFVVDAEYQNLGFNIDNQVRPINKALRHPDGDLFILQAEEFCYDLDCHIFGVQRLDANFQPLFDTNLDALTNSFVESCHNRSADFVLLPNDQLLVIHWDRLIILDANTGEVLVEKTLSTTFECIEEMRALNETTVFILENGVIRVVDQFATFPVILPTVFGDNIVSFDFRNDQALVGRSNQSFEVLDANGAIIHQQNVPSPIQKITKTYDGDDYLVTTTSVYKIEADFGLTLVYENEYHDILRNVYKMNGELGVVVVEDEAQFETLGVAGPAIRKAQAVETTSLPDMSISSIQLAEQSVFSQMNYDGELLVRYWVDVDVEIENLGSQTLRSFHLLTSPTCHWQVDYCSGHNFLDEQIPAGEKATVSISTLLDYKKLSDFENGLEYCVTAFSPNYQYDRDYSNNNSCEVLFLDTNTKELLVENDIANIFPNPASEMLTIDLLDESFLTGRLEIYSAAGQLIVSNTKPVLNQMDLNQMGIPAGIHLLKLTSTDDRSVIKRFVKY